MGRRILLFLLLILLFQLCMVAGVTDTGDLSGLNSLKDGWQNTPPSWVGADPCGSKWVGIGCTGTRVTSITLASIGLTGQLSGDIATLTELQILDLSYNKGMRGPLPAAIENLKKLTNLILVGCSFSGPIPNSIGSLQELIYLSLNSNGFTGTIPPSIGSLSKLYWLDLAENQLEGPIPVSSGTRPGLDLLIHAKHFHLGMNKLSGTIPSQLFSSNMKLIHVLFDSNSLTGTIPSTLTLVQSLEVVRFDRNALTGRVPSGLNSLTNVSELFLSNNQLTGPLPNLTGMNVLNQLDLSNNSFDATDFPSWLSTLQSLTTIMLEDTQLGGQVPPALFSLSSLQTVVLKNNKLNGTLDIGTGFSSQLQLVDLEQNSISAYTTRPGLEQVGLILLDNPVCQETQVTPTPSYCTLPQTNSSYSTPPNHCVPVACAGNRNSSPNCKCAYPYTGLIVFRAPSFSDLENTTHYGVLSTSLMTSFKSQDIPVDSVALSNPRKDASGYLDVNLAIFPSGGESFNDSVISTIGFMLSNQTFKPPKPYGPYYFIGSEYQNLLESSGKSSSTGIIVGAVVGGCVLVLLLLFAGLYGYRQKKRAEKATEQNNPFAHWDTSNKNIGGVPQLQGAKFFSFEELKKCTHNFSEANDIGSGGYGKVYRGALPTGELIAIKRAQHGSMQGGLEFKNEIELLSRVHHKNLVSLIGFCFERGEQMLIYEYVPNGSLRDSLSGKTGIRLDWIRRLKVALGSARGLAYLHELANPPIIHRDIKSSNILLDGRLNAKVGDFGLSKPLGDTESGHVTTQVKGTMGYLDPEYYMTQRLTEKSDVYSFGVVMLELVTGRQPIERGRYIVREIKLAMDRTKDLYNLHELLDTNIGLETSLKGIDKFVDLAMHCVQESGADRPTMGDVVKEIENILQLAGLDPKAESASTSASYEDAGKKSPHHPYSNEAFEYSGAFPPSKLEPL